MTCWSRSGLGQGVARGDLDGARAGGGVAAAGGAARGRSGRRRPGLPVPGGSWRARVRVAQGLGARSPPRSGAASRSRCAGREGAAAGLRSGPGPGRHARRRRPAGCGSLWSTIAEACRGQRGRRDRRPRPARPDQRRDAARRGRRLLLPVAATSLESVMQLREGLQRAGRGTQRAPGGGRRAGAGRRRRPRRPRLRRPRRAAHHRGPAGAGRANPALRPARPWPGWSRARRPPGGWAGPC